MVQLKSDDEMDTLLRYVKQQLPIRTKARILQLLSQDDEHREWLAWCAAAVARPFDFEQSYFSLLWRLCETYRWFTHNREFAKGLHRTPPPLTELVLYAVRDGKLHPVSLNLHVHHPTGPPPSTPASLP